jgi:GTP-binding protein Era
MNTTRSGYAALAGKPNAGKSTLLNALLNQKIAITTSKPQTTRKRILGILTEEDYQIIFLDTPGIIHPRYLLQERMMEYVSRSLHDADVILLILDASNEKDVAEAVQPDFLKTSKIPASKPVLLILNKIDLVQQDVIEKYFLEAEASGLYKQIIPLSATLKVNTKSIVDFVLKYIPEHPFFFPADIVSDEQERFFVKEIIREKILTQYRDEIPYSCEVSIDEFTERETKHFIRAIIYVEKDSQVSIVVGKKGDLIKKLGERSRADIEKFLDHEVYLELRVKVRDSWRRNEKYLREFGYDLQDD